MKVFFIVNESASSVTPRVRQVIQQAMSMQHDVVAANTQRRGHATRLAQGAVADGADAVVVLGGDGTLNEAANGLAGSNVALGALPGGSTNVFARTLGFSNDTIDGTAELLNSMMANKRRRIGLGQVNGRYFLFHVGAGFDAAVVEQVESRALASRMKRYAGHPVYVWWTLLTLSRYGSRKSPERFLVSFPETPGAKSIEAHLAICMNSDPYTFLGSRPFNVAPGLDYDNGMAVFTIRTLRVPTLVSVVSSALFSSRRLERHPHADLAGDVNYCEIRGTSKIPYQLDGDYLGDVDTLTLRHVPSALDVFVPLDS